MDRREVEPEGFGYCNLHETPVDESEYEWKGCWNCEHFSEGEAFPYVFVSHVSKMLGVSESTVKRWIKNGLLKGEVFERGRTDGLPARKLHIERKSFDKLRGQKHTP